MPPFPGFGRIWAGVLPLADDYCGETGLAINELMTTASILPLTNMEPSEPC